MSGLNLFGWKRRTATERAPARVPEGVLLYAVGDIHGRSDLLLPLLKKIGADAREEPAARRILLFVGDYVDRGPDSRGVIDAIVDGVTPFETVFLKGNHEAVLLDFLDNPARWEDWRRFGGLETLASYGVDHRLLAGAGVEPEEIRDAFLAALPRKHLDFLRTLLLSYECGDYYFVHAGARPGIPLDQQIEADQLWIREGFLDAGDVFGGRVVVHGHTPKKSPERRSFRIGIDTGAYLYGCLTAARFMGDQVEFLQS